MSAAEPLADIVEPGSSEPQPSAQYGDARLHEIAEFLWEARHRLPADMMRTLGDVLFCASAARFGGPYEPELYGPEEYAQHCTSRCEAEDEEPEAEL